MSQEVGSPSSTPSSTPLPWSEVWIRAITRPSVSTFEGLLRDPKLSSRRALTWMFISRLIGYFLRPDVHVISVLAQLVVTGTFRVSLVEISVIILGALGVGLQSVLELVIGAGITHVIARALGGIGTYSQLVYATAAYLAPWTLINTVAFSIPLVNFLVLPLAIYLIVLNVIAVKAVHQFGWGKAIASNALNFVGILVVFIVGGSVRLTWPGF